jgi:hypothetical protein
VSVIAATWFETRGNAALLTMRISELETRGGAALLTERISDLILRSPPQVGVSKDGAPG